MTGVEGMGGRRDEWGGVFRGFSGDCKGRTKVIHALRRTPQAASRAMRLKRPNRSRWKENFSRMASLFLVLPNSTLTATVNGAVETLRTRKTGSRLERRKQYKG